MQAGKQQHQLSLLTSATLKNRHLLLITVHISLQLLRKFSESKPLSPHWLCR